jgi:hypothetical protein
MINLRLFIYFGIVAAARAPLSATINASDLLTNSPFVHAKVLIGQGANGETAQQYVFHGVCKLGDDVLINISDTVKKKAYWIKTGETQDDINVVSYDAESKKVSILVGSRDYTLDLSKPKVVAAVKTPAGPNQNMFPPPPPGGNPNNSPLRRIHRVRRPGSIPPMPPSMNFNDPNFQRSLRQNGVPAGDATGNEDSSSSSIRSSSGSSSTASSTSGIDASITANDAASLAASADAGTSTTPPSSIPSSPPSYVPEMPESVRTMIESGATPSNDNSSN